MIEYFKKLGLVIATVLVVVIILLGVIIVAITALIFSPFVTAAVIREGKSLRYESFSTFNYGTKDTYSIFNSHAG